MTERRYSEEEVAAIFADAADTTDASRRRLGATAGMTLTELQSIGREVGLSEDAVADAAARLDARPAITTRKFLGVPVGVGRSVGLGRRLDDADWEKLVVDLRATFDARGRLETHGSLRQWSNGNLQALVEPSDSGDRLVFGLSALSLPSWARLRRQQFDDVIARLVANTSDSTK